MPTQRESSITKEKNNKVMPFIFSLVIAGFTYLLSRNTIEFTISRRISRSTFHARTELRFVEVSVREIETSSSVVFFSFCLSFSFAAYTGAAEMPNPSTRIRQAYMKVKLLVEAEDGWSKPLDCFEARKRCEFCRCSAKVNNRNVSACCSSCECARVLCSPE